MSLKEIAEMTGVSVSTVSRVLNNPSATCASPAVKDRIWEAARQTGYVPNETAQSLRRSKEMHNEALRISIILSRVTSLDEEPFFAELLRNLEEELYLQKAAIDQIVFADESVSYHPENSDGIILLGRCSEKLFSQIRKKQPNLVGVWRNPVDFLVDEVICDGKKAAETAMEYLISLGHRKIAYIGDCSNESRYVGYCNTLISKGIPLEYNRVKQTGQTKAEAVTAFSELLQGKKQETTDFSAVFCANDISAIGVLETLAKEKKKLRDRISVISIDNIEEAENVRPYLTTINIPRKEMAHMAVKLLKDRIDHGHSEYTRIEFPCRLIQRGSCRELRN